MSIEDERSLADEAPEVEPVDIGEDVTAEDSGDPAEFNIDEFLAGVRPTERSIKIYAAGHLAGVMDELAQQYDDAEGDDEAQEQIEVKFNQVRDTFHASARQFYVRARSSEWRENFRAEIKREYKLKIDQDDSSSADDYEAILRQLQAQITYPEGVTYEHLVRLSDVAENEVTKLIAAITVANTQPSNRAKVATPGFSLRSSEKKPVPGSKRR